MGTNYVKKARTERLPVITDTQINAFSTGVVQSRGSYILNGTVFKYPDGTLYTTQRPSFSVFNSPSDSLVTDTRGRGIYYWAGHSIDALYFVNNDGIYKGTYGSLIGSLASGGTEKVHIAELNGYLVFVDPQGQQMMYIDSAASTVVNTMNTGSFPALPQNNSKTLASGVAVLDKTMYVLATDGTVWGCALNDPTDWTDALNFVTAEKEDDSGVHIDKHYDHIVVFGRRTIEFFYDAANPTGSPLATRQDISHNIGCADPNSVWRNGDDIYFLGIDTSGQIQPYVLREYRPEPIANGTIASFLTTSKSLDSIKTIGSGMSSGGVTYYVLTIYNLNESGNIAPTATYVYNSNSNIWAEWEFAGTDIDNFPLVGYTITDDSRIGEGIMSGGRLVWANDNYVPVDSTLSASSVYVTSGYVATGYVITGGGVGSSNNMTMKVRTDNFDAGNRNWKFAHQIRFVGDSTVNSQDLTIRWNDNNNVASQDTYTGSRTIDISNPLNKLTRLGRFKSRSFEFEYSGDEQIRVIGLDLDISEGTH